MSQWCVESYPSSLYKFEIFSKLMFLAFWRNSGRDQGGPNPCLELEYVSKIEVLVGGILI